MSAYVSISQQLSALSQRRQVKHTSAYVSIRQHMSAALCSQQAASKASKLSTFCVSICTFVQLHKEVKKFLASGGGRIYTHVYVYIFTYMIYKIYMYIYIQAADAYIHMYMHVYTHVYVHTHV